MFVLTADQQGSRRVGDRVEELLQRLQAWQSGRAGVLRGFERTVGDEVQAVAEDATDAVDVALLLLRWGGWSVGIGAGPVDHPLPTTARAGSGAAFVHARTAVERAKTRGRPVPLAVEGADATAAQDAEAVLVLLGVLADRRTASGWEVVDALTAAPTVTQDQVAQHLGITQQAVSQRLRTALWSEEVAARPAAGRLLRAAAARRQDGGEA